MDILQNLFSSRTRVALLTHFFSHPTEQFYARELGRRLGEHYNAVWRELNNLEAIGMIRSEERAGAKYYQMDPEFPIYEELRQIIYKTTGLGHFLRHAPDWPGAVEWAFIYGSVAAGEEDRLSDIDLMLIGDVELTSLADAIAGFEDQLGRAINYLVLSRAELMQRLSEADPFLTNVLSGPKIMLIGEENDLRAVVAAREYQAVQG